MPFPNFPDKHKGTALFSPEDWLAYLKKVGNHPEGPPPEGVILCYQRSLWDYIQEHHATTPMQKNRLLGNVHYLDDTDNRLAVAGQFGIGAPVAAIVLEELIAFGAYRFISVGTAGSLLPGLDIGDLVVCDQAVRDEGTSYHYLPPSKTVLASPTLTASLTSVLESRGIPFRTGPSWTIDAPYRETTDEIRHYQEEGVLTVEMEAAALFAVAAFRSVSMGILLTISDSLADIEWKPEFHHTDTQKGLETLYQVAVEALQA